MKIEHTINPSNQIINFLTQKIDEEIPNYGVTYPFAFFMRNEDAEIIAGCNGSIVCGSIYTDQLWVHPDYRKTGLGRQLMQRVHEYGKVKGCNMSTVCTMSFQHARTFYEKLGYVVDFERGGYAKDASCLFLKKML